MKRRVRTVILLLLLGAIVNVAVAWGCVMRNTLLERSPTGLIGRASPDEVRALRQNEFIRTAWGSDLDDDTLRTCQRDAFGRRETWYEHPSAADITLGDVFAVRIASGWPCLALDGLSGQLSGPKIWQTRQVGAWRRDSKDVRTWPSNVVPLVPLWPGFAINTLFYAVILWGIFAAPFALRRRRRIKRGLCPKCAYPVGTNERCTECGAAVSPIDASSDSASLQSRP